MWCDAEALALFKGVDAEVGARLSINESDSLKCGESYSKIALRSDEANLLYRQC